MCLEFVQVFLFVSSRVSKLLYMSCVSLRSVLLFVRLKYSMVDLYGCTVYVRNF